MTTRQYKGPLTRCLHDDIVLLIISWSHKNSVWLPTMKQLTMEDLRTGTRERSMWLGIPDPNWSTLLALSSWKWPLFFFDLQQQSSSVAWCLLWASCTARLRREIQKPGDEPLDATCTFLLLRFPFPWDSKISIFGKTGHRSLVKLGPPESEDSSDSALSALSLL
jgi:hypothetical protein